MYYLTTKSQGNRLLGVRITVLGNLIIFPIHNYHRLSLFNSYGKAFKARILIAIKFKRWVNIKRMSPDEEMDLMVYKLKCMEYGRPTITY